VAADRDAGQPVGQQQLPGWPAGVAWLVSRGLPGPGRHGWPDRSGRHRVGDGEAAERCVVERADSPPRTGRAVGGLGYVAAGQGRRDDAVAILAEAADLAAASGAQRILRSVEEAQAALAG